MDTASNQKLRYRIYECSGEDPHHPVAELLTGSPQSSGWQSQRFCSYPQHITFQFLSPVRLTQIQFLSHENKIASKLELFTALPDTRSSLSSNEIKFKKLGFLCLDPNEGSNFQLRELKTVYVEAPCLYLKVAFHKCHINKYNFFNQVGLIAIAVYGEPLPNAPSRSLTHSLERKERTEPVTPANSGALRRIKELEDLKQKAIEAEDFENAQRIKQDITKLKNFASQIQRFEDKRVSVLQNEDYESAEMLQAEIDKLKDAMAQISNLARKKSLKPSRTLNQQNSIEQQPSQKGSLLEIPESRPSIRQRVSIKAPRSRNNSQQKSENGDTMEETKVEYDEELSQQEDNEYMRQVSHRVSYEDQIIPTLAKKNMEIVEERPSQNTLVQEAEELSQQYQKLAEPLAPVVGAEMCKKIFSKHWNLREEALKTLVEEAPKGKQSQVIISSDEGATFAALVAIVGYTIGDRLNQVSGRAISLLKMLLMTRKAPSISAKSELGIHIDNIMIAMLEKIADTNQRNREQAEEVVLLMARNPLVTCSFCVNAITKGGKFKGGQTPRHILARLKMLQSIVKEFKINNHDVPYQAVVEYTIEKLEHPSADIRGTATAILVDIYGIVGDKLKTDLEGMKLAHYELLLKEFDGGSNKGGTGSPAKSGAKGESGGGGISPSKPRNDMDSRKGETGSGGKSGGSPSKNAERRLSVNGGGNDVKNKKGELVLQQVKQGQEKGNTVKK